MGYGLRFAISDRKIALNIGDVILTQNERDSLGVVTSTNFTATDSVARTLTEWMFFLISYPSTRIINYTLTANEFVLLQATMGIGDNSLVLGWNTSTDPDVNKRVDRLCKMIGVRNTAVAGAVSYTSRGVTTSWDFRDLGDTYKEVSEYGSGWGDSRLVLQGSLNVTDSSKPIYSKLIIKKIPDKLAKTNSGSLNYQSNGYLSVFHLRYFEIIMRHIDVARLIDIEYFLMANCSRRGYPFFIYGDNFRVFDAERWYADLEGNKNFLEDFGQMRLYKYRFKIRPTTGGS